MQAIRLGAVTDIIILSLKFLCTTYELHMRSVQESILRIVKNWTSQQPIKVKARDLSDWKNCPRSIPCGYSPQDTRMGYINRWFTLLPATIYKISQNFLHFSNCCTFISEVPEICVGTRYRRAWQPRAHVWTQALASVLGPFGVHLPKLILPSPYRLEFPFKVQSPEVNPHSSPPVQSPVLFTMRTVW